MAHTELGLRERRTIEDMLNAKISVDKIAAEIGRHRSTVFREIKRNRYIDDELPKLNGYYGMTAQRSAVERRARRLKLVRFVDLRAAVIEQLKEGWSPEQIAGRLQFEGQSVRVSHETIYAYVLRPRWSVRRIGTPSAAPTQKAPATTQAYTAWPCFPARSFDP